MKIELYYAPVTCALAPYVTLTEAKAEFEVRPLNFRKGQHNSPEYLKLNPKHKVPLLIVDGKVAERERGDPDLDRAHVPAGEAAAGRSVAGVAGDLADVVVLGRHPSVSGADQFAAAGLRRAGRRGQREEACGREPDGAVQDRRRSARRAASSSSIISPRRTRTSSGVRRGAQFELDFSGFRTAPRISSACSSGRACRRCWRSRSRCRRSSPRRRSGVPEEPRYFCSVDAWLNSGVTISTLGGRSIALMNFNRETSTALAWLILFVMLTGCALVDRGFKQSVSVIALN